jgi:hypothetical protein
MNRSWPWNYRKHAHSLIHLSNLHQADYVECQRILYQLQRIDSKIVEDLFESVKNGNVPSVKKVLKNLKLAKIL